jgi:phosphoribosylformimino-5-aminoimidazole carboxamide ribonucleotide (ProFAR) isomerase
MHLPLSGDIIKIIPFIPVLNGNVVVTEGKRYRKLGNAVKTVKSSGYDTFYVIDINGLIKNRPQINIIQEMSKEKNLWVESGVRFAEDMMDVFMAGAEYAVLNSMLVGLDELKKICSLSQNLMLHIECKNDRVHQMDIEDFADKAKEVGIKKFVMESRDYWLIKKLAKNAEMYIFAKKDEIKKLGDAGVSGVLLDIREELQ